jgi:diadenosine tetraphosphate (Ap4A) HIT family hydrolase
MNISALAHTSMAGACRFCVPSLERWDRPIFSTPNYTVVPSLGSLVPGWTLIVPKAHDLNLSTRYDDTEFRALRKALSQIIETEFATPARFFEHGPRRPGSLMGCGVDHAHGHVVPLNRTLEHNLLVTEFPWQAANTSEIAERTCGQEYLFYTDDPTVDDPLGWLATIAAPTSQFFRKLIAHQIGRSDSYDYRSHQFQDNIDATLARLSKPARS